MTKIFATVFRTAAALVVALVTTLAASAVNSTNQAASYSPKLTAGGMTLIGADDFNGTAGALPSSTNWTYDLGGGGWGNNEKQTYTKNQENVRLNGSGQLIIEARQNGTSYTSARVVTRGKVDFGFGLIEARVKFPSGQGIHPALWMLGSNIATVGWPACGEIDIMELVNTGFLYHNAIHGPTTANPAVSWKQSRDGFPFFPFVDLAKDYHVYQLLRSPGYLAVGIDGVTLAEYKKASVPTGAQWVFDAPMYMAMNVAVGGNWPGPVNSNTKFPATMLVDYIRVWQ